MTVQELLLRSAIVSGLLISDSWRRLRGVPRTGMKLKEVNIQTHQWIRRKTNNRQGKDILDIFSLGSPSNKSLKLRVDI